MATSPGWGLLGHTIAGGNQLTQALAYDQGEALGAKTQDALAQARSRIDENNARANISDKLQSLPPELRDIVVGSIQAHVDPAQILNSQKTSQEVGFRNDIVNPGTGDDDVARRLLALGHPASIIASEGEGQVTNRLHPSQGVQLTDIGTAIAGQKHAQTQNELSQAALHTEQTEHPERFRLLPPQPGSQGGAGDGSAPIKDETTAQLVAQGLMAAPTAGTRSYLMLGGEEFIKRVNFLAGQQGQPGAAPPVAPGAVPPAAAGPAIAPGAPGGVPAGQKPGQDPGAPGVYRGNNPADYAPAKEPGTGDIKLPTEKPQAFRANFDANAYGQRRTTLNDLARKSGTGGNDDALNRTAGHLDVYEQLMANSGNANFKVSNAVKNWFQEQTGKAFPNNTNLAAQILGTEIVKSMTSIGAGTGEERGGLASAFANTASPEKAREAITTAERLLREQAVATNQRVTGSGVKDYYSKYLTPTTRRRLSLDTAPAAGAPPPAAAGGVPTFQTEQEAEAAGLPPNTKIMIGGRPATWQ